MIPTPICKDVPDLYDAADEGEALKEKAKLGEEREMTPPKAQSAPSGMRELQGEKGWAVSFSGGQRTVRIGSRWHDYLTDSTWEVVAPAGRSYSPSGLGGCQDFWCKPVGELRDPEAIGWIRDYARADGCVEFCGDSIAAGLIAGELA